MKKYLFLLLFPVLAFSQTRTWNETSSAIYGKMTGSCIRKQLATTGDNRLGTALTSNKWYLVSCDDNAGAGVACACRQGTSSVSVDKANAWVLKAGAEYPMFVDKTNIQISCQSYSGTPYVAACPFTP